MLYHIENEHLFCSIDDQGAQLHSIKDRAAKTEYLWQGDPAVWYGQSPVLFPIVGRLRGDCYVHEGQVYAMPKHGFARKSRFRMVSHTGAQASFVLESNDDTRACYPFEFTLTLTYRLEGRTLCADAAVENRGSDAMYCSIGAHPGFNCQMGDILRFDQPETLDSQWIDNDSLLAGGTYPVLRGATDITLHEHLFDKDALILGGVQSKHITLVREGRPCVKFDLGGAPVLGIWAKPGAPYVCIEPWFGLNDPGSGHNDSPTVLREKALIQTLEPSGVFTQAWRAELYA